MRPPGTESVPWQATLCVACQVELRSRLIEAGSTGAPREHGARLLGRPSFGYFPWLRKESDQPPGCPRPLSGRMDDALAGGLVVEQFVSFPGLIELPLVREQFVDVDLAIGDVASALGLADSRESP